MKATASPGAGEMTKRGSISRAQELGRLGGCWQLGGEATQWETVPEPGLPEGDIVREEKYPMVFFPPPTLQSGQCLKPEGKGNEAGQGKSRQYL